MRPKHDRDDSLTQYVIHTSMNFLFMYIFDIVFTAAHKTQQASS